MLIPTIVALEHWIYITMSKIDFDKLRLNIITTMANTPVISSETEKEAIICCVCMENINTEHTYISCYVCKDGNVCSNCYISMLENGLLANCPLCRQEKWYKTPLLVDAVDESNDESNDESTDDMIMSCPNKLCERVKVIIKLFILLGITWQLGAFIMNMLHSNYLDNMNVAEVLFIFIPGGICMGCMRCCYKHVEFTRH